MLAETLAHPVVFYGGLTALVVAFTAFVVFLFRDRILFVFIMLGGVMLLVGFAVMMVWAECGHYISCQGG